MNIPSLHPMVWLVSIALLVIAIGGTLIRSSSSPTIGSRITWSADSTAVPRVYTSPSGIQGDAVRYGFEGESVLPTFSFATNDNARTALADNTSQTLEELRAYLAERSTPQTPSRPSFDSSNIYSFLPNGDGGNITPSRTPEQIALRAYGNEAGAAVGVLEATTAPYTESLPAFFSDPSTNTAQPLLAIAKALDATADTLNTIESIPANATDMHQTLINKYQAASLALRTLASVRKNEDFLDSINTYNKRVEELGSAFVALVIFFAEENVTFGNTDPGAVFMFSGVI